MKNRILVVISGIVLATMSSIAWSAKTLDIITPNGGEKLVKGKKYDIEWNTQGYGKNRKIKIELLKRGKKDRVIVAKTRNDGTYEWKVPTDVKFGKKAYQLRVVSVKPNGKRNGGAADKSDKKFSFAKK